MDDTTNQSAAAPGSPIGTVLVTGASRGLGLEFARSWLTRGAYVIATCRNPGACEELQTLHNEHPDQLRLMQLDVKEERSIELLASALGKTPIDLLINNAGVLYVETLANIEFARINEQFRVNALGALHVTCALLNNLNEGARIVNVTSRMGSLDDNTSGGYYGYRMSYAAQNMATRSLAVDLRSRGMIVVAMHPGMVQTDMTRGFGMLTAAESVDVMNQVIATLTPEHSGQFLHYQGTTLPW
jgi:NAD(P)-dependent dehydrogenase (short-subunit alcohol dehydrogenase family)